MSNIDLSALVTAADKALNHDMAQIARVKTVCRRRIFAVIDEIAQINLAAAVAADQLPEDRLETYRLGLDLVKAMRDACQPLVADPSQDPERDDCWPPVPAGVAEMAAQY